MVTTSAIGGSRPRGTDAAGDAAYAGSWPPTRRSWRNTGSLSRRPRPTSRRSSVPGPSRSIPHPAVRMFSHVMLLVTTIRGELTDAVSPVDLLAGNTPAGAVCGSPREAAIRIGS
ncbi:hypothetical protein E1182_16340 [Micromonospora sp. KC721]|nr:hypothetical protein E1182_16340 [Micromonospora sp. KC721]